MLEKVPLTTNSLSLIHNVIRPNYQQFNENLAITGSFGPTVV